MKNSQSNMVFPTTGGDYCKLQHLVSTNSLDLKTNSSLSEDSGLPHTNSSISSGDSIRVELCKFEFELIPSDSDISPSRSMDNYSDGGMSGENFNTLKKGPGTPIDPPPEFQDSPQTTMLRSTVLHSYALKLSKNIINRAIQIYSLMNTVDDIVDIVDLDVLSSSNDNLMIITNNETHQIQISNLKLHNIDSCSAVLSKSENNLVYDIPNIDDDDDEDDGEGNGDDIIQTNLILNESLNNLANNNNNLTTTTKTSPSSKLVSTTTTTPTTTTMMKQSKIADIYDYDIYYGINKQQSHQQTSGSSSDSYKKRKPSILYSPLNYHHHHHHHHHHHNSSNLSTSNRPNSRNSLNSRLSSSHNSLYVPHANKADDSIFITQAMSHDALTGREISDFYNVPVGSDIYALPIDVIQQHNNNNNNNNNNNHLHRQYYQHSQLTNFYFDNQDVVSNKYSKNNNKRRRKPQQPSSSSSTTNHNEIINLTKLKTSKNVGCSVTGGGGGGCGGVPSSQLPITTNFKRLSISDHSIEPTQMTLDEVKQFYNNLYSNPSDKIQIINKQQNYEPYVNNNYIENSLKKSLQTSITKNDNNNVGLAGAIITTTQTSTINPTNLTAITTAATTITQITTTTTATTTTTTSMTPIDKINNKKLVNNIKKKNSTTKEQHQHHQQQQQQQQSTTVNKNKKITNASVTQTKRSQFSINLNLKQKLCSIFRFRRSSHHSCDINNYETNRLNPEFSQNNDNNKIDNKHEKKVKFSTRALPPLPNKNMVDRNENLQHGNITETTTTTTTTTNNKTEESTMDFAANIEKVKEYGWYWGPISSESAEKILSNEPDGSFIVRDSSDDHYIFSLTFKLNNTVRHVRIEQDQGTFSFGSCAKFKSHTIMEFIENAVESSRSGRYLFFFHRRPEHGPMRVQLTNPVSRFKHIQSLQHMCRFVIRKVVVRKDLISSLPLPRRLLDYLSYKHCYSEQVDSDNSQSQTGSALKD